MHRQQGLLFLVALFHLVTTAIAAFVDFTIILEVIRDNNGKDVK